MDSRLTQLAQIALRERTKDGWKCLTVHQIFFRLVPFFPVSIQFMVEDDETKMAKQKLGNIYLSQLLFGHFSIAADDALGSTRANCPSRLTFQRLRYQHPMLWLACAPYTVTVSAAWRRFPRGAATRRRSAVEGHSTTHMVQ